jgi:hypothetical protein
MCTATGPGDQRRGGTHGEASPQQRVQPPGAPTSVKKGQPQHGIRRKLVVMGGGNHTQKEGTDASREEGRRAARGTDPETQKIAQLASQGSGELLNPGAHRHFYADPESPSSRINPSVN